MPSDDYCLLAQVGYLPETYILGLFANYLNDYINNIYILSHWNDGFKIFNWLLFRYSSLYICEL